MKRIALLAMVSGLALAAAAPAGASTIYIGYSINGGAITTLASGTSGNVSFAGTVGNYSFNTGAFGFPVTNQFDLLTQSINVQSNGSTAATLNVYVTETDLPTFGGGTVESAFTSNTLQNATAVVSSFYSSANAQYTGTLLKTASFSTPGTFTGLTSGLNVTGPFSLTTRYDITFGSNFGNFNGTANLTAVPEPASWGLMILGFAAMGAVMRRRVRSTKVSFA